MSEDDDMAPHHHRRDSDNPAFPGFDHERMPSSDSGLSAAFKILGMPVGTIAAICTLLVALFGVWLAHDRAIASVQVQASHTGERVVKLEQREDERLKSDAVVAAALARIETKLDDVKERVERVENRKGGGR